MSLLIATPMYGHQCYMAYFTSCLALQESCMKSGMDVNWLTTGNESLIQRARNTSAMTFLTTPYQKLMFIDADIEFSPEDVAKLWNLNTDIAVAAYSMKRKDRPLSAWKDGKLVNLDDLPVNHAASEAARHILDVDYAGTGFMMIDRGVFEAMIAAHPEYEHIEGQDLTPCWSFFDCRVEEDKGKRIYLSEDYFFCKRAREMGYSIKMDTTIRLKHWGTYAYA